MNSGKYPEMTQRLTASNDCSDWWCSEEDFTLRIFQMIGGENLINDQISSNSNRAVSQSASTQSM
jgi:hypothetical protein